MGHFHQLQQRDLRCKIMKSQKQGWTTGEKLSSKQQEGQVISLPLAPTKAEKDWRSKVKTL